MWHVRSFVRCVRVTLCAHMRMTAVLTNAGTVHIEREEEENREEKGRENILFFLFALLF